MLCAGLWNVAAAATLFAQAPPLKLTTLVNDHATSLSLGPTGVLYGTASQAVFSITPPASPGGSWTGRVLYEFTGGSDGSLPNGLAIGSGPGGQTILYGTTLSGGSGGGGTVFSLTPPAGNSRSWTEKTLYSFTGDDGFNPRAGVVIGQGGALYGTTGEGGTAGGNGTVFSLMPPAAAPDEPDGSWSETVLYSFDYNDGSGPGALAMDANGVLYGGTLAGGSSDRGTVFSLTPPVSPGGAWTEAVLHDFPSFAGDGWSPITGLAVGGGGVLYGVTSKGGTSDFGIAYALTPPATSGGPWTETLLHQFLAGASDGLNPDCVSIIGNGVLLGAVAAGGRGAGGVFWLTPPDTPGGTWSETILRFPRNGHEGKSPASLVMGGDAIYGTTGEGGSKNRGTIFVLHP
ncbi:MAG TPA: choice-of-anchor tandem repeat GloVer-containing protein [Bryobacteraceae bacterium]|jgi:uncharacterized repeat protein (TIGR03803 family)|nr:choice-of-anchor tandem repeat GloVer-containing protein [Bryobacteraceae bacterium]